MIDHYLYRAMRPLCLDSMLKAQLVHFIVLLHTYVFSPIAWEILVILNLDSCHLLQYFGLI